MKPKVGTEFENENYMLKYLENEQGDMYKRIVLKSTNIEWIKELDLDRPIIDIYEDYVEFLVKKEDEDKIAGLEGADYDIANNLTHAILTELIGIITKVDNISAQE